VGNAKKMAAFLAGGPHAVVGASRDRDKYGNKVLRCYLQHGRRVFPVNPQAAQIEGLAAYGDLGTLPEPVHGISVITPPRISEWVIEQAAALGIERVWMQPGAESIAAIARAEAAGMSVIADGSCILVELGYAD
jgi:predicted CoA-binding protein